MVPKQIVTFSVGHGSWEITVDGEVVGTFEGTWSGEVEGHVELKRVDVELPEAA